MEDKEIEAQLKAAIEESRRARQKLEALERACHERPTTVETEA